MFPVLRKTVWEMVFLPETVCTSRMKWIVVEVKDVRMWRMRHQRFDPVSCRRVAKGLALASVLVLSPAFAQDSSPQAPDNKRYELLKSGDDMLRIDRQAGRVSFCRKANDIWRCVPAPMAEEAYQAEIAALTDEVDRLRKRLAELESLNEEFKRREAAEPASPSAERPEAGGQLPDSPSVPPADEESLPQTRNNAADDDVAAQSPDNEGSSTSEGSDTAPDPKPSQSEDDDLHQLDRMLEFSDRAMRRLFGLMNDLKNEIERSDQN